MNLAALHTLLPDTELSAIEINAKACDILKKNLPAVKVLNDSILDFHADYQRDLALIKGVLIHINPNELEKVYKSLYHASAKYICMVEYYNPTPMEVPYRGHEGRLFKRDFAGEMLDRYPVKLIDYGFFYHRDNNFPLDDVNWFLLEKE